MMKLTDQQKKWIWIAAAVLITIHFGSRYLAMIHPVQEHAAVAKPSPLHYASPPPAVLPQTAPTPPSPAAIDPTQYLGVWVGSALMPDDEQETCKIRLELVRNANDSQKLTGYESKSCIPTPILQGGRVRKESIPQLIRETRPIEAVLTGSVEDGEIVFQVDKTISTSASRCGALRSFSLTPFGRAGVTAEWQEGSCPANEMNLTKARG
jgi:hypothetical protein